MPKSSPTGVRNARPSRPLDLFPSTDPGWDMPEGTRHRRLCDLLYQILTSALGPGSTVGADNFIYFDEAHPRKKCAPDAFVKLGVPQAHFGSWKTWTMGTPELCVEILSPSDTDEKLTLSQKLARFAEMGTAEVVSFDVDAAPGKRLRIWDRVGDELVERVVEGEATECRPLGLHWVLREGAGLQVALRLARDAAGRDLFPGLEEERDLERAQKEAERAQKEEERTQKELERMQKEAERTQKELERAGKETALAENERLQRELDALRRRPL